MSKSQTTALWMKLGKKNELDIIRFRHNEVNVEAAFHDHQNTSYKIFLSDLDDLLM